MFKSRTIFIVLLLVSLSRCVLSQDTQAHFAQLHKDAEELQGYTLTMDIVTRTLITSHEMDAEIKTDHLGDAMKKARGKGDFASIDQLSAAFSTSPKLTAIVTTHGFTAHSLAVALTSIVQTIMSAGLVSRGKSLDDLPFYFRASAANIKFFHDHKDELGPLFQKYPIELF